MATISITTPSDGQTIDASDVATPLNTIVSEINGSIDSDNIASGGVVPNNLTSGTGTSWAWQSWTPTWTGLTEGNGTLNFAKYIQIGKTVHFRIKFTLGSTSSMTTGTVSLPVTASSEYNLQEPVGINKCYDASNTSNNSFGTTRIESSTTARPIVYSVSTYLRDTSLSSSIPFSWTTSDYLYMEGTYEAA